MFFAPWILWFSGLVLVEGGPGTFSFASTFGSHMVLQQAPVRTRLWGYAEEVSKTVIVYFRGTVYATSTLMGSDGEVTWSVLLDEAPPGGPHRLTARLGQRTQRLRGVLVGDVWFCSGQSNMAYSVSALNESQEVLRAAVSFGRVRLFKSAFSSADSPQAEPTVDRTWSRPTADSVRKFSAICWLFGTRLQRLLGRPVGLIQAANPASRIEAWSSPAALRSCFPRGVGPPDVEPVDINRASVLWNAMVHPFLTFGIKGVLWYQGEWNKGNPEDYGCALSSMISDWRRNWFSASFSTMDRQFPFGQVQLAPWRRPEDALSDLSFPALRWSQTAGVGVTPNSALPHVFTAVAMDLPDFDSPYGPIHPRSKDPIARRLVVGAMREAYGQPVESRGPFPTQFILQPASNQSSTTDANATLHVVFDDNSRAVEFRNLNISDAFEVCCSVSGTDCNLNDTDHWFVAKISATGRSSVTLFVPCDNKLPTGVRYAWRESPCPDGLENCVIYSEPSRGSDVSLPAPPFFFQLDFRQNKTALVTTV